MDYEAPVSFKEKPEKVIRCKTVLYPGDFVEFHCNLSVFKGKDDVAEIEDEEPNHREDIYGTMQNAHKVTITNASR